jgi:arylsulfatase A-like enzyme
LIDKEHSVQPDIPDDANRDRPFFLYLAHNNPHIPFQSARPSLVDANRTAFEPAYAATIQTLDDSVGRLLAHLDTTGLRDRTIVIFTSDNGGLHVPEGRTRGLLTTRHFEPARVISTKEGCAFR